VLALTTPAEERSAWRTSFLIMLFFSVLAALLEGLNFFGVTQFPLFTLEFLLSIVYIPTCVLAVGWAYSRAKETTACSGS